MTSALHGKRLLVVEDDDDLRHALAETLGDMGALVEEANGGWAAWELIQRHPFDVVVTDVRMPQGDGLELISRLRAAPRRPAIVALSGHADIVSSTRLRAQVDRFVAKPCNVAELLRAIEAAGSLELGP